MSSQSSKIKHLSSSTVSSSQHLNNIPIAKGERHTESDSDSTTVGYTNMQIWHPRTKSWHHISKDSDKFLITVPGQDIETAWSEFFARWHIFIRTAYKLTYLKIEQS